MRAGESEVLVRGSSPPGSLRSSPLNTHGLYKGARPEENKEGRNGLKMKVEDDHTSDEEPLNVQNTLIR